MKTREEINQEYVSTCIQAGDAHYKIWAIKKSSGDAVKQEEAKLDAFYEKMYDLNQQAAGQKLTEVKQDA